MYSALVQLTLHPKTPQISRLASRRTINQAPISNPPRAMTSTHKQMFEGVGAPVNVAQTDGYLDPVSYIDILP